jgi:hypothetical protein
MRPSFVHSVLVFIALAATRHRSVVLRCGRRHPAGYGLPAETGWTTLLRNASCEHPHRQNNARLQRDTTAGGEGAPGRAPPAIIPL